MKNWKLCHTIAEGNWSEGESRPMPSLEYCANIKSSIEYVLRAKKDRAELYYLHNRGPNKASRPPSIPPRAELWVTRSLRGKGREQRPKEGATNMTTSHPIKYLLTSCTSELRRPHQTSYNIRPTFSMAPL